MNYLVVIPARYKSSRYPGKPLIDLNGKAMIHHVYDKCAEAVDRSKVLVATDDNQIFSYCENNHLNVVMTSENCATGTDRVYEAVQNLNLDFVVNVQGDEPLIKPEDVLKVINIAKENPDVVVNAMTSIKLESDFRSKTVPKVVHDLNNWLLYMSRAPVPTSKEHEFVCAKKQVCIYSFPVPLLKKFYEYGSKTPIEKIEDIEILRFLELGFKVLMTDVSDSSIAIDTPEDVKRVLIAMNEGF